MVKRTPKRWNNTTIIAYCGIDRPYLPFSAQQQLIILPIGSLQMTTTLRDLIGGKVIEANRQHIVISKDGRKFEIGLGTTMIREMNKHQ